MVRTRRFLEQTRGVDGKTALQRISERSGGLPEATKSCQLIFTSVDFDTNVQKFELVSSDELKA